MESLWYVRVTNVKVQVSLEPAALSQQLFSQYHLQSSIYMWAVFTYGSLGHAIEHEQVMGSCMTFNVQH